MKNLLKTQKGIASFCTNSTNFLAIHKKYHVVRMSQSNHQLRKCLTGYSAMFSETTSEKNLLRFL